MSDRRFEVRVSRATTIAGKTFMPGATLQVGLAQAQRLAASGTAEIVAEVGRRGPPLGVMVYTPARPA